MDLRQFFALAEHGGDTFVGTGPRYAWGGLYGGHIVAQSLRAAANTVAPELLPHSLRAYFIRRGDHTEPVRYEVDRIRNGKSFCTRRVIARQAVGAILNLEASFHSGEEGPDVSVIAMPRTPGSESVQDDTWSPAFDRRQVSEPLGTRGDDGLLHQQTWVKVHDDLGADELLHRCAMAYISDDFPTESVLLLHPKWPEWKDEPHADFFAASLDHTIWFHRPVRVDQWHLYDFACHGFVGGRGLSVGHIFQHDGTHVATVSQEVLLRERRPTGEVAS